MFIPKKLYAIAGALLVAGSTLAFAGPASAASPTVTLNPSAGFFDQQTIEVSVGPNSFFTPNASIKILECAVGATSDAQCDGNTQNADAVIVKADGSFDYKAYVLYQLPSSVLGEPAGNQPVCNGTVQCTLYVGQNQNDFSQPHIFSSAFVIASTPPSALPESGHTVLFPLLGGVIVVGGAAVILRRRSKRTARP
jgi:LPXTG-motif cell wall-anchored protein